MWSHAVASVVLGAGVVWASFLPPRTLKVPLKEKEKREHLETPLLNSSQQGREARDLEVTRLIRQKIVAAKDLSSQARNVKIITQNGRVVLEGLVRSSTERQRLEAAAREIAGYSAVQDQTTLTPD